MKIPPAFLLGIGLAALGFSADLPKVSSAPAKDQIRSVVMGELTTTTINAHIWVPTLIVLPEDEKIVSFFCGQCISQDGQTGFWQADRIPGSDRYLSIKPGEIGARSDLHIITDHGNTYTFRLVEVSKDPSAVVDLKLYVHPADGGSLAKAPVFVTADAADRLKAQVAELQAKLTETQADADKKLATEVDQIRAKYPAKLQFDYRWNRGKNPFGVEEIYRDDKFTYLRLNTQELPSLYEVKDGKKSLIEYRCDRGMCTVPKILDSGVLTVGKASMQFWREMGS